MPNIEATIFGKFGGFANPEDGFIINANSEESVKANVILTRGTEFVIFADTPFQMVCLGITQVTVFLVYPVLVSLQEHQVAFNGNNEKDDASLTLLQLTTLSAISKLQTVLRESYSCFTTTTTRYVLDVDRLNGNRVVVSLTSSNLNSTGNDFVNELVRGPTSSPRVYQISAPSSSPSASDLTVVGSINSNTREAIGIDDIEERDPCSSHCQTAWNTFWK